MMSADSSLRPEKPRKLVYGHAKAHDCLAFADADTAPEEAGEITAIFSARTWGEARSVPFRHTSNPARTSDDVEEHDKHGDDEPFDIHELNAVSEGDWPEMVTSRALDLLPEDIQTRFAEGVATVHNGDYLKFPLAAERDLLTALRERGFEVTRDDDLINKLDAYDFLYG
ncbi:hypothetical protein [Micromonospora sp. DT62]|uniref:hypothetical protein n=1 Tax=Micromonospora sp. DT62 TaxID=3416521 RepID=UPI003CFAC97D